MDEQQLDRILAQGREPSPADEEFVRRVMAQINRGSRRRGRLRLLARPAVLAAAAVLVAGGALAAVRVVPELRAPRPQVEVASVTAGPGTVVASAKPKKVVSATPAGTLPPGGKVGDAEYNYTSEHTAYAVDRGVRLELETYVNQVKVGVPQRVTLSLENTGAEPVTLYAFKGCMLVLAAFLQSNGTTDRDKDVYRCAESGQDPRAGATTSQESETVVLKPGQKIAQDTMLVLPEGGDWQVLSHCLCYDRAPKAPAETPRPGSTPRPLISFGSETPAPGEPQPAPAPSSGARRLVTPPIHFKST